MSLQSVGLRAIDARFPVSPGELSEVAHKLAEAGVNLHAIYVTGVEDDLIELAIVVDNRKKAKQVLD